MRVVWHLLTARFADSAFTGEGARLYGGRWNRKGVPMVYTAGSQSLAALEMLVQDAPLRARYVMIPVTLPKNLKIERVSEGELPADWRDFAAREHTQAIGTAWAKRKSGAVSRRISSPTWNCSVPLGEVSRAEQFQIIVDAGM